MKLERGSAGEFSKEDLVVKFSTEKLLVKGEVFDRGTAGEG